MTSSTSFSAPLVFTWKKDGALTRMRSSQIRSPQEPLPESASTPAILRALAGPFCITRTTEVALTASPMIFAAWARGKGPGRPHRATSASPVASEARMPTRSISSPCEFAR